MNIQNHKKSEALSSDEELEIPAPMEVRLADMDVDKEFKQVNRKRSLKTPPPSLCNLRQPKVRTESWTPDKIPNRPP